MVGWHHRLNGHGFEQAPGTGDGQGSLVCCSPWGHRVNHNWVTEVNLTECSLSGSSGIYLGFYFVINHWVLYLCFMYLCVCVCVCEIFFGKAGRLQWYDILYSKKIFTFSINSLQNNAYFDRCNFITVQQKWLFYFPLSKIYKHLTLNQLSK